MSMCVECGCVVRSGQVHCPGCERAEQGEAMRTVVELTQQYQAAILREREAIIGGDPITALQFKILDRIYEELKPRLRDLLVYGEIREDPGR